jgi:CO/xanthine dehydrogenase FAD-binding subunit
LPRAISFWLDSTELLTEVVLPKLPANTGWGFEEIVRRHGDFALAAVAATLTLSGSEIVQARIALTGVGPTPLRAAEAESLLVGRGIDESLGRRAIEAVREAISPETDLHASADLNPGAAR